jgi:hypothetical protein
VTIDPEELPAVVSDQEPPADFESIGASEVAERCPPADVRRVPFELVGFCTSPDGWTVAIDTQLFDGRIVPLPAICIFSLPPVAQLRLAQWAAWNGMEIAGSLSAAIGFMKAEIPRLRNTRVDASLRWLDAEEHSIRALRKVWQQSTQTDPKTA